MNQVTDIKRNSKGQIMSGSTPPNPMGRKLSPLQNPAERIQYYVQNYTLQELQALRKDHKRFNDLIVLDAMIITRMIYAFAKESGQDFDRIIARGYGSLDKLILQTVINNNRSDTYIAVNQLQQQDRDKLKDVLGKMLGKSPSFDGAPSALSGDVIDVDEAQDEAREDESI